MKVEYRLDKEDIRKLVAKVYEVSLEEVTVVCFESTVGYGQSEHQEPDVCVFVEHEGEFQQTKIPGIEKYHGINQTR